MVSISGTVNDGNPGAASVPKLPYAASGVSQLAGIIVSGLHAEPRFTQESFTLNPRRLQKHPLLRCWWPGLLLPVSLLMVCQR